MSRFLFAAAALTLFGPGAFACDGQTGKVIFEDKFADDAGGWSFGDDYGLSLKAPGAILKADAADGGSARSRLNETFSASQGDFCVDISFPQDATQLGAAVGVMFLATDNLNKWEALARADGRAGLYKMTANKWSTVWETPANSNLVKTGPTDVNFVRAVVKDGAITVIVNGQTVKTVRAKIPDGDLKFGFGVEYNKTSAAPVSFPVLSYKVTSVE
jgi:hypothetical protein